MMLAIDHINGVSDEEKKLAKAAGKRRLTSTTFHSYVLSHPEEFQILCHNCNMAKSINGGTCPHKVKNV